MIRVGMREKAENNWRRPCQETAASLARFAALVLFLASKVPCGQQALPASLQQLFADGVQAQKAGRLDAAEKAFLQVLGKGGKAPFVYSNLGIIYQLRADHQRAIAQFREAIRLQPDYVAPHVLMGASLLALGKVPEATRRLQRAVRLQPREPLARFQLAKAHERAGNFPGVVEQYLTLRELAPQEPEYTYQLGNAYLKFAGWCFQEIVRLNPRSARVFQTLAENYRVQGRPDLAIRAFQRAARVDPNLPGIHFSLAQIYQEQGKRSAALQEIEHELRIVPEGALALALKQQLETPENQAQ